MVEKVAPCWPLGWRLVAYRQPYPTTLTSLAVMVNARWHADTGDPGQMARIAKLKQSGHGEVAEEQWLLPGVLFTSLKLAGQTQISGRNVHDIHYT